MKGDGRQAEVRVRLGAVLPVSDDFFAKRVRLIGRAIKGKESFSLSKEPIYGEQILGSLGGQRSQGIL